MDTLMEHKCSSCSHRYSLPPLPAMSVRLQGEGAAHVPFSKYVYAICPRCGFRDWADERKYFGFAGPRTLYSLGLAVSIGIVALVMYLGFFFKV